MFDLVNNDVNIKKNVLNAKVNKQSVQAPKYEDKSESMMKGLDAMANINKISFTGKKDSFEFGLSMEELEKRTNKDYMTPKKLLKSDSPEYTNLAEGDKEALKHLVKAAKIFDKVYMEQDNPKNVAFKEFLESRKGDKQAELTLMLFNAQKGMSGVDRESNMVNLAKGEEPTDGKGYYPKDLQKEEFHNILIKMLENGDKDEVQKILSGRTMVQRDGSGLKAVDYTEHFAEEFSQVADELEKAAETSTNADFNEYLTLQAKALRENDPMLDAYADKKWAELQDTPLEFTISREQYADMLTGSVVENEKLNKLLEENGIEVNSKDSIGCRVGIVNKEGTESLLKIKKHIPSMAQNMPYNSEYEQNISSEDNKQTMVDVDLVTVTGDEGAYRGGVTLAQNLPNNDKLSLTIDGGKRNVYHRQIRFVSDPTKLQKRLDAILDSSQHNYYENEADHWFTIGHENVHSIGPKSGTEKLGKYKDIVEENKADMGAIAFLDLLENEGMYTPEQKNQIIVTYCADNFLKSKPDLEQAHRVRSVMQNKYFLDRGAIEISDEGKIKVNIEKVIPTAQEMLAEIVKVQMSQDFNAAEKYVTDNFVWTDSMQKVADNIKTVDKSLNGYIESELADELAQA